MVRRPFIPLLVASVACGVSAAPALAQGRISVEGAGMYQRFTGSADNSQTGSGMGWDAQLRYWTNGLSIGAGVDYVQHDRRYVIFNGSGGGLTPRTTEANFTGVFIEPRFGYNDRNRNRTAQPYFFIRAGYGWAKPRLETATSSDAEGDMKALTWNGGIGFLLRIVGPLKADVSLGGGLIKWKADDADVLGQGFGTGTTSTGNVTGRIGFSLDVIR